MKGLLHRRPSASMIVALLALVVAASGTAIASFGPFKGDKIIKRNSLSGNRLKGHTVSGDQINLSKLGKVPNAVNADVTRYADSAGNAQQLGGVQATGYVRVDCGSQTGQIRGSAYVPASGAFSSTFVNVAGAYNCSGQPVQARRTGPGAYEVKLPGNPAAAAVGSVNVAGGTPHDTVTIVQIGPGDYTVLVGSPTTPADDPFEILVP